MTEKEAKTATVIITVDVGICCSSKKIMCALCMLQNRFNITSIVFDEKKNTITVSGAFDPDSFIKEIRCLADKAIKNVEIKKPEPPKKPPPPPPPAKVDVSVSFSVCGCCQPHHACCRCCSWGHVSHSC